MAAGSKNQKPLLFFSGSEKQREILDENYPGISREYGVQHFKADEKEPVLHGCGLYARGWRQIGHVFDPAFDPS